MTKLSVVVSAFNEEKKIAECLRSVAFADEIIVVDNESTDKTAAIAKKHKAKVYSRPNNLMLNINKNYGFSKATGDWILNLDADERTSVELQDEIKHVLHAENSADGYLIPRKNIIFEKWMKATGWYPDYHLRLFKAGKGRFAEQHVHEQMQIKGSITELKEHIEHDHYESVQEFLRKTIFIYAPNEAEQILKKGYTFSFTDAITFPFREFIGRYFARQGYKDGFHGVMLSLLMAFYHLIVFAYLWEKKRFTEEGYKEKDLVRQVTKSRREYIHWRQERRIQEARHMHTKLYHKLIRKVSNV